MTGAEYKTHLYVPILWYIYYDKYNIIYSTGCPKKHGNSVTNWISSLLWISIIIPSFKSHNIIMSARSYFMKRVKDVLRCIYNVSARWTVNMDKFTLFVYCNFLVLLSLTGCSQNINKQNVNIADETLTDYSFLSRYHYTKSKNYSWRRYRIRHWIPMFFGTPCTIILSCNIKGWLWLNPTKKIKFLEKINREMKNPYLFFFWRTSCCESWVLGL